MEEIARELGSQEAQLFLSTGLRIGELLALQWRDIDFENLEISVMHSISLQHIGQCKTELYEQIREEAFGEEIGRSSWLYLSPAERLNVVDCGVGLTAR